MTGYVDGVESEGGIWCTLALGLFGNNHRTGERDELRRAGGREGGKKG